jgi:hypothetical protein
VRHAATVGLAVIIDYMPPDCSVILQATEDTMDKTVEDHGSQAPGCRQSLQSAMQRHPGR